MDYEGAVIDLDGTVYRGEEPVAGAAAAVDRLRAAGLRTVFFSNNPTRSRAEYAEHLGAMGIKAAPEDVLSAGTVTARALAAEHADDAVFLIGAAGLRRQLEAVDVELVADATVADVLLVSYDRTFDYDDMLAGYRALAAGATFYGTDPDRLVPAAEGMVPGSGAVLNAVGGTVDRDPERVFGKPSLDAQRAALEAVDAPPERCVVVGDRLETDVALGEPAGMTTVLVRTGVATDADRRDGDVQPDHVVDSLADLPGHLG
jgi:4-nitrophenyl phosphatase